MPLRADITGPAQSGPPDPPGWIGAFAGRIFEAWTAGTPMPQFSAAHPEATLADGYAVQRQVVARFAPAHGIGGYKAAGISSAAQAATGIDHPLIGVVPQSGVLSAGQNVVIDLAEYPNRHIETEVGFRFNAPISEPVPDIATLRSLIAHIVAVVELPGGAVEKKHPHTAADTAAWNANGKELITGLETLPPDAVDVDAITVTLTLDGATVSTGRGAEAAGGQMLTLLKCVNSIVEQGYPLEPGHVHTNGAVGTIFPAAPGDYLADFGPLGKIAFAVTDSRIQSE
ncbi:MAG TPA: hypothetical protein PKW60_05900 [Candidatus Hydrogenedentes bacterium]|nr:hypothetical protein [Candidatus Hydrogenedentota bacterium]